MIRPDDANEKNQEAISAGGAVPTQPEAKSPLKKSMPLIIGLGAIILIVGISNAFNAVKGNHKIAPKSSLVTSPTAPSAQQVKNYETQQQYQAQKDEEERKRKQQIAELMAQYQQQQAVPGPESTTTPAMTAAQSKEIYGDSANAPKNTSNTSELQAEAKQRSLERQKRHQDAVNSGTVAIDFLQGSSVARDNTPRTEVLSERASEGESVQSEEAEHNQASPNATNTRLASAESNAAGSQRQGIEASKGAAKNVSTSSKSAMSAYEFDTYAGRLYRVFEGTVFEGVVTNHIDGALPGPIIVMLTTDYYSHDHQQLLLPQGTRLIGDVQSVGSSSQRKLFVVFNRVVCPDGFSLELNKYIGLDPLGTTGLATKVNNHYLSSFAAAAAIGGLGGLAQIGNTGSVLTAEAEIRNGISEQTALESEQILNKFLNRLPVITVKEGSRARIYITQDILIPSYAEHRVDPTI